MAESPPDSTIDGNGEAKAKRNRRFRLFGALIAAGLVLGGIWWLFTKNLESTDDAFIEADVVQMAPLVGGRVLAVHFSDNQKVAAGQALLEIDPADYQVQLAAAQALADNAKASIAAAGADLDLTLSTTGAAVDEAQHAVEQSRRQAEASEADARRAESDVQRYQELFRKGDASKQRLDQAVADARSSNAKWLAAVANLAQIQAKLKDALAAPQRIKVKEAQLANARAQAEQAEANLHAAQLNLSYTRLAAPQSGRIARKAVNQGDVVQRNQTLTSLVLDPPWVIANFKETQLTRMRPGQPATITVDAFPGHKFNGRLDSLQPGSGARFSLLPPENATGNYVKVVQRVPVKITFDDLSDPLLPMLGPGMSVEPTIDVGVVPGSAR